MPGTATVSTSQARTTTRLDEATRAVQEARQAKPALKTCLDYSVKYQYFDEYSPQLRGVAREELQGRVPRRRRAPRRADAVEQRSRRQAAAAHRRRAALAPGAAGARPPTKRRRRTSDAGDEPTGKKPAAKPKAAGGRRRRSERMKTSTSLSALAASCVGRPRARGCGGGGAPSVEDGGRRRPKGGDTPVVEQRARRASSTPALDAFVAHDKANDWNDGTCARGREARSRARRRANERQVPRGDATTRARVPALQRRQEREGALRAGALATTRSSTTPAPQLALYQYKADGERRRGDRRAPAGRPDAQFQNVPALVNLAMFQMQRDSAPAPRQVGCKDDMRLREEEPAARARHRRRRTCPRSTSSRSTTSSSAKKRGGPRGREESGASIATNAAIAKRADVQQLELAALVCSQAIRKNANYAPIHNTAGLIQNELGQVNSAGAGVRRRAASSIRSSSKRR